MLTKELLIKFLKNEIDKQQLKTLLKENGISTNTFNEYIFSILKMGCDVSVFSKTKKQTENSLKTNEFLDDGFIKEIKATCLNRKMQTSQGIFRLSKQDIQKKMAEDRKLQAFFVLKRINPFNLEEIDFRMKRCCIEFGLEKGPMNYGNVIYEGVVCYIRNLIDRIEGENKDEKICEEITKRFTVLLSLVERYSRK